MNPLRQVMQKSRCATKNFHKHIIAAPHSPRSAPEWGQKNVLKARFKVAEQALFFGVQQS
jgi:hypothetical protein